MNIIFIRHGQGEHTLNPPESLKMIDPYLTRKGIDQSSRLIDSFPITADDIIIASPTRRTIETALHWDHGRKSQLFTHNAVGPRMFPLLPASRALPCDNPLSKEDIQSQFPQTSIIESELTSWNAGINALEEPLFYQIANEFIHWCRKQNKQKIYIVSHDGTITSYRKFLGETTITRNEFLGETGFYQLTI